MYLKVGITDLNSSHSDPDEYTSQETKIFFMFNQFLIYGAKQLKDAYRYFTMCMDATLQFELDKDFCILLIYPIPIMRIAIVIGTSLLKKTELLS